MAFNPELGSTSPAVLLDNAERLDKLVNGDAATVPDRAGDPLYSWRGIHQNLIPLSRQYMTLAAAQGDIANIPVGSTTYYRSPDDSALAVEVMNVSGTLQPTGRKMLSQQAWLHLMADSSSSLKTPVPVTFSGELLNGATGWNGFNICPSQYYGGWSIPAGATGYNSYVSPKITLTPSLASGLAGKRVLFIFGVTHSAALRSAIENPSKLAPYAWINGVAVTDPALQAIAISDTESVVLFETDITSG
ncbi:TPA: hypothetical protein ACTX9G_003623, partial [Klebsiella pneumoniae]